MIKIVVDSYFIKRNFTGVGRYLKNLLENLIPLSKDDFYFYLILKEDFNFNIKSNNYEKVILKDFNHYSIWQNIGLKNVLKRINYDVFWSPNYILPAFIKSKSLLTIHDVSWKVLKNNYSYANRFYKDYMLKKSLRKTKGVFTVSEFTKAELLRYYKFDETRIYPVYHGIEEKFRRSNNDEIVRFRNKYGIKENTKLIGFIGSMFKRRNINVLIESFIKFKDLFKDSKLFLVGEVYDNSINGLLNINGIIHLKRIDENEIVDFYSSLDLFVYISEYEGFGFPPLEALSCNTIPLILNKTSLKEIFSSISLAIEKASSKELYDKFLYFFENRDNIEEKIFKNFEKMRNEIFNWKIVANTYYKIIKELYL